MKGMILIPAKFGLTAAGFDITILTISLLFRKPKQPRGKSSDDLKSGRAVGWYLIVAGASALFIEHFASYTNYAEYFSGLALDAFLFYTGLKVVVNE